MRAATAWPDSCDWSRRRTPLETGDRDRPQSTCPIARGVAGRGTQIRPLTGEKDACAARNQRTEQLISDPDKVAEFKSMDGRRLRILIVPTSGRLIGKHCHRYPTIEPGEHRLSSFRVYLRRHTA